MSWLTQILRNVGLGSVLDDIEAAEKNPTAATIGKAIEGAAAAAPAAVTEGAPAATMLVSDLGTAASQVVISAANKINPGVGTITAALVPDVLAAIETAAETALKAATGGVL